MEELWMMLGTVLVSAGVPSAICGLIVWRYKRSVEQKDREEERKRIAEEKHREEKEKRREDLMLMMTSTRENTTLCMAIARAVQRIPDAKCNGDMKKALERVEEANKKEKDFLISHGVQHIFE